MRIGRSRSSEVQAMTLHDSVSRLAFLLSMRAAFIAIACSLGAPAFAVDVKAIAPRRPPRLSFELIPSHTRRPVAVAAARFQVRTKPR
jgi:hypothetical protein